MNRDENDRARDGNLPEDPAADARKVSSAARVYTVRDLLQGAMNRAMMATAPKVCTTGVATIDHATGGMQGGWCWVIGAESNWGKSQLAVHLADENMHADERWKILIVSAEDTEEMYGDRLLCRRARVSADNLRLKRLTLSDMQRITAVAEQAERKPLFIDARNESAEWASNQVTRLLDADPMIVMVIYDYLTEFRSDRRHQDRRNETEYVAKILRGPVKQRGRVCVLLSQISETDGKMPTKAHIAESKAVGKGAEVVALGFTPAEDVIDNGRIVISKGTRCLHLDKVKQGRNHFVAQLNWDDECACFRGRGDTGARYDEWANEAPAPPDYGQRVSP